METYTASTLLGRTKAAAWNELLSSRLEKADLILTHPDKFEAELRLGDLGPIRVVRMLCGASSIERTPRHIAPSATRTFSFLLQVSGNSVFTHYGHEATLSAGDFLLYDNAAPHSCTIGEASEIVMLRVPANVLKEHLPSPEYFCGRRLSDSEGLTRTIGAVTTSLCAQLESGLSSDFQNRVARHLLDLISTSYAMAFDSMVAPTSSIVSGRHAKVKLYIEQHLRDPELSPCAIADRLKLSSRYLRMIFATSSETVSAYILRRRLEECARQMSDPRWGRHSIAEIAFAWGFNSAPHFTRSFRERYGLSPRHYRRQNCATA